MLRALSSPEKIQAFVDRLPYSKEDFTQSVRVSLRTRMVHCFDGALVAAAALEAIGYPPLLLDLRAVEDDDHILALFKRNNCFGAVAKSNYSGLRYREPVYRTPRELALSYFEDYFNLKGKRTLREYSVPFDLGKVKDIDWRTGEEAVDDLADRIDSTKHFRILSKNAEKQLVRVDERSLGAGKFGRRR